jgi:hypothetical protein
MRGQEVWPIAAENDTPGGCSQMNNNDNEVIGSLSNNCPIEPRGRKCFHLTLKRNDEILLQFQSHFENSENFDIPEFSFQISKTSKAC